VADDFRSLLAATFAPYQALSEIQLDALHAHYELLCKWNKKLNLWRVKDIREAVELHYCESLYLARTLPPGSLRVVDVGSGAGFPGFPIAILRSSAKWTFWSLIKERPLPPRGLPWPFESACCGESRGRMHKAL